MLYIPNTGVETLLSISEKSSTDLTIENMQSGEKHTIKIVPVLENFRTTNFYIVNITQRAYEQLSEEQRSFLDTNHYVIVSGVTLIKALPGSYKYSISDETGILRIGQVQSENYYDDSSEKIVIYNPNRI